MIIARIKPTPHSELVVSAAPLVGVVVSFLPGTSGMFSDCQSYVELFL